ncbi:MAG: hypothetical protein ACE5JN_00710 [Candidatus Methylomirabilia bacterium]
MKSDPQVSEGRATLTEIESVLASRPVALSGVPLQIDRDEVLRFHGYRKGSDRPTLDLPDLFESALGLGEALMAPAAVYRAVPVTGQTRDLLRLVDGVELRIPGIERLWGSLRAVGVAICTVGAASEIRVRELLDARELPLAMLLDAVGSAAAECLAEYVNDWLCQLAIPEGQKVTNRVSPGYAGWEMVEQALLFHLCPGDPAGVTLSELGVMSPAKSISFLAGIGPEAHVDHYFTQCRRCWVRECAFRRAPAHRSVRREFP